jgi:hypothetical protein
VKFFDTQWKYYGNKKDLGLCSEIRNITGIPRRVLRGDKRIEDVSLLERLSWSIKRETTKEEDKAYCLLGLVNITMEAMYGEGVERAFKRLSCALHDHYPDQLPNSFKVAGGGAIMKFIAGSWFDYVSEALPLEHLRRAKEKGTCINWVDGTQNQNRAGR